MRVADYIFEKLADVGVKNVFMISGGGAMFLNNALGSQKRIKYICNHHEQGSAIAAEGYARITNQLAVVNVTTGPGGTNSLTGVIGQWLDSLPVLYLSGQVKFETTIASCPELPLRQLGDQEINIIDIVRPVTKYAKLVRAPNSIRYELEKAIHIALSGRRGPVWLDIPLNVQGAEIDPESLEGYEPELCPEQNELEKAVEKTLSHLYRAKAPVIIAGHGIRLSGGCEAFNKLIAKIQCPVLATFNGFDLIPTGHRLSIGRVGTIGTRSGNIALQNADFVLCIGTRNNIRQVSYNWGNFAKKADFCIVVDIDPAELRKKSVKANLTVEADAGDFIKSMLKQLTSPKLPDCSGWLKWNQERKLRYPAVLPEYRSVSKGVQPYFFTETLTRMLPENAVVACTNATPSITLFQGGIVKPGQRMLVNSGCAAMGFGLPAALGAAAAVAGRHPVICLEGDGSLMMNMQELQTVFHNKLPIKLFLYANNEYSSIRQTHDAFFAGHHTGCDNASGVTFPCWEKVAKAFGWPFLRIESHDELDKQIATILAANSMFFCEVVLTPGYEFSPKLSSQRLPDGRIISKSLEDMYPFLSDEEMARNVYQN